MTVIRDLIRPAPREVWRSILQRRGGGVDADAAAWAAAVTAAGGTYSATTLQAVSTFAKAAKAAGYWSKLNRINLFCGDQLAAALVPLKVGAGNATETNVNFVAGDYTEATGLTGNGSTKYLQTGLIPSASLTLNDTHMAVYNRSSSAVTTNQMGAGGPMVLYAPHTDSTIISDQYNSTTGRIQSAALGTPFGFLVGSRNGAGSHAAYRNGASVASNATSGGALPTIELYVFAINNFGTPASFSASPLAAYSFGAGLSGADVSSYYTHLQAFQTALGRQV